MTAEDTFKTLYQKFNFGSSKKDSYGNKKAFHNGQ